jgi:hypothetical protein
VRYITEERGISFHLNVKFDWEEYACPEALYSCPKVVPPCSCPEVLNDAENTASNVLTPENAEPNGETHHN